MSYPFDSNQSGLIPQWDEETLQPDGQLALEGGCELSQYGQMPRSSLDLNSGSFPFLNHSPLHGAQGHSAFASSASYTTSDNLSGLGYGDWRGGASSHVAPIQGGDLAMPGPSYSLNSDYSLPLASYSGDYSAPFPPVSHSQDPLTGSSFFSPGMHFPAQTSIGTFDGQSANVGPSHLEQQFGHLQFSTFSAQEDPLLVEEMLPIPGSLDLPHSLSGSSQNNTELNPPNLFQEHTPGASGYNLQALPGEDQSDEDLGLTKDGRPRKRRPKKSLLHLSEEEKRAHEREVNSGSTARYRRKKVQQRETLEQQLQQETERMEKLQQQYDSLLLQKHQFGPGGLPPQ